MTNYIPLFVHALLTILYYAILYCKVTWKRCLQDRLVILTVCIILARKYSDKALSLLHGQ